MRRTILTAALVVSAGTFGFVAGRIQSPSVEPAVAETTEAVAHTPAAPVAEKLAPEAPAAAEVPAVQPAYPAAEPETPQAPAPSRRAARKAPQAAQAEAPPPEASGDGTDFRKFAKHLKQNGLANRFVRTAIDAAEAGNQKLAQVNLKKALRKNPHHAVAHLLSGVLAQLSGDLALAQTEYSQYLKSEPDGDFATEVRAILESGLKAPAGKVASR
ncbi:MAG: hypothetical protein ACT4TC_02110 [Myxococcaceae bacterium]